jgi:hypothetical protein
MFIPVLDNSFESIFFLILRMIESVRILRSYNILVIISLIRNSRGEMVRNMYNFTNIMNIFINGNIHN